MKAKIEAGVADAKKDIESNDAARMHAAVEKLSKLGGEIYAHTQQAAQAAGAAAGGPAAESPPSGAKKKDGGKSDVVDADFEVVDDNKK